MGSGAIAVPLHQVLRADTVAVTQALIRPGPQEHLHDGGIREVIGCGVPERGAVVAVHRIHGGPGIDEDLRDTVITCNRSQVQGGGAPGVGQGGVGMQIKQAGDHHEVARLGGTHEYCSVSVITGIGPGVAEESADAGEIPCKHDVIEAATIHMSDQVMAVITRGNWKHTRRIYSLSGRNAPIQRWIASVPHVHTPGISVFCRAPAKVV